ncbi:MAG: UDP-2,3-diacylglucosamine diphosphatase [Nevskiales bacterium]
MARKTRKQYRSVWVSDVHLGTSACKAEELTDFLGRIECEQLYLVGDIVDGWRIQANFHWPQSHTNVVRKLLSKSRDGTKVIYVTGNHDEFLRKFSDYRLKFGNIRIVDEAVHTTADGRRLLVIHGDQFDVVTRYHRWLALAGDKAYDFVVWANAHVNRYRRRRGQAYWSLAAFLKHKVKTAVSFISEYERALAHECRRRGLDGVICGHIHHPEIRPVDGVTYHNCGDWVESCTALAEHPDGRIEILRWRSAAVRPSTSTPFVLSVAA